MRKLLALLPLDFRVLYSQFLLRIVDLEALSIQADVIGYLGQFAGVLMMLSLIHSLAAYNFLLVVTWKIEEYLISTMMLVVGLFIVASWDATFPDKRDVMVLSPLPIAPHTILFAKVAASAAVLGLAILTLNVATGFVCPFILGSQQGTIRGVLQSFVAYWFTMIAASVFLYSSVLSVQGLTALLLPRRHFLRLSAFLQIAAFGLFLGMYFLHPEITTPTAMADPANHRALAWSPSFWFFALFNQLNGSLPPSLAWLALRGWVGLGAVVAGATASLLVAYRHILRTTVEEPDLVPATRRPHWVPGFGSPLRTALMLFNVRSLLRSRNHRVRLAFYLAVVFAIALSCVHFSSSKNGLSTSALRPMTSDFLMSTFMMMSFAVVGLRSLFPLPISLTANWILRITQVCPSEKYIATTRWSLLLLAVVPVWLVSAILSCYYRPLPQIAAHLIVLAVAGWILTELTLIGFSKVPFACSYLPGKSNLQAIFWGFVILTVPLAMSFSEWEQNALCHPLQYVCTTSVLGLVAVGLWAYNRRHAKFAILYFEELPPEIITTLGLA